MPTTVILGTGIIGLSTAYYLSQFTRQEDTVTPTTANPVPDSSQSRTAHEIHLVEPSPELFASASGKAAGFLAKDWFAPAVAPLGVFSFGLHRKLAEEHGGREGWGWSESTSYSLDREDSSGDEDGDEDEDDAYVQPQRQTRSAKSSANGKGHSNGGRTRASDLGWLMDGSSRMSLLDDPAAAADGEEGEDDLPHWLRARRSALQVISDRTTTGQVDPHRLCQFLLQQCLASGVKLHQPARATQLLSNESETASSPTSIRLEYVESAPVPEMRHSPNSLSPPPESGSESTTASVDQLVDTASFRGPSEHQQEDYLTNKHAGSNGRSSNGNSPKHARVVDIACDSIVITAGCWTPRVYRTLFPNAGRIPRVTALAGHSVVLKSKRWPPVRPQLKKNMADVAARQAPEVSRLSSPGSVSSSSSGTATVRAPSPTFTPNRDSLDEEQESIGRVSGCHAVFTSDRAGYSPEIFSRLSGDVWLGGLNSSTIALPALATQAAQSPDALSTLIQTGKALCGEGVEVLRTGLCFRPVTPTGRPVIAKVHEADLGDGVKVAGGVYVATGHGPWGISLSLGTGHVVGEMVLGKEPSVDVTVLSKWEAQAP